jgi:hypothetical protein
MRLPREKNPMVHKALQSGTQDVEAVPVPHYIKSRNFDEYFISELSVMSLNNEPNTKK